MQGDVELATWALERDDTELKIPYMNMAKEVIPLKEKALKT